MIRFVNLLVVDEFLCMFTLFIGIGLETFSESLQSNIITIEVSSLEKLEKLEMNKF